MPPKAARYRGYELDVFAPEGPSEGWQVRLRPPDKGAPMAMPLRARCVPTSRRPGAARPGWYVCDMKLNRPRWKWALAVAGGLAGVCFLAALFLALSGRRDQWINSALSGAFVVIVVLQLTRRSRPGT